MTRVEKVRGRAIRDHYAREARVGPEQPIRFGNSEEKLQNGSSNIEIARGHDWNWVFTKCGPIDGEHHEGEIHHERSSDLNRMRELQVPIELTVDRLSPFVDDVVDMVDVVIDHSENFEEEENPHDYHS